MTAKLIAALRAAGLSPAADDVADMLWLASRIGPTPIIGEGSAGQPPARPSTARPGSAPVHPQTVASPNQPPRPDDGGIPAPDMPLDPDDARPLVPGLKYDIPADLALPDGLGIARALRPFSRRIASRLRFELDEEATVQQIADQRVWLPVLRATPERRFDLALVVEAGASMGFWRPTITEFRRVLEQLGAFRDVRVWKLRIDRRGAHLITDPGVDDHPQPPEALVSPVDERLILLVSDGLSDAWRDGTIGAVMQTWGRHHPTAIVRTLPPRLWPGTALDLPPVLLRAPLAGAANVHLLVEPRHFPFPIEPADEPERGPGDSGDDPGHPSAAASEISSPMPVPIVWLAPRAVARWARMAIGSGGVRAPGVLLPAPDATGDGVPTGWISSAEAGGSAEDLVRAFHATASTPARLLAGHLAAVPLNLPVMRFVQRTMLPGSSPVHLAEIFLGGLLRQTSTDDPNVADDETRFDYLPGVRELLLQGVTTGDVIRVLTQVDEYLAAPGSRPAAALPGPWSFNVRAFLANPARARNNPLPEASRPFAEVMAKVLSQLDGRFREAGEVLEQLVKPPTTPPNKSLPNALMMDLILSDLFDDTLLNDVYAKLSDGQIEPGMNDLFLGLQTRRQNSHDMEWAEYVSLCTHHPLKDLLFQDPFTRRAAEMPRGYAGDPVVMDMIYSRDEGWPVPEGTSDLGRQIFDYTTSRPAAEGVRELREFIADTLDRLVEEVRRPHVLSIAAGHLREAMLSSAVRGRKLVRFVALDQDTQGLEEIDRCYAGYGVEVIPATIRQILMQKVGLGEFDLVYSMGLFNYVQQTVAQRLVWKMFQMLRPRGRILVANFQPGIPDVGYMDSFMNWRLLFRTRQEMLDLTMLIPQAMIRDIRIFTVENQNIVLVQISSK